jgi:pimeloyl-ACP methyl ester carboxylesterase
MKDEQNYSINIETTIEHLLLEQDGYTIHYYASGTDKRELIVFVHPAFGNHHCFDQQIDFFASNYRVVTIDLLGHGLSQVEKAKDKIDISAEHLRLIIEKEGFDKAHFVGVSMGTLIAQHFALLHPEKVNSMTILGGYDINSNNKEVAKAQRIENVKWMFKALFSMNSFRRYTASKIAIKPESQARFYEMAQMYTRKSFTVMSGLGNILKQRENVKKSYPMLFMSGDRDIDLSIRMTKSFHENEPNSEFHLIPNAGHCANMDNEREFNKMLMAFLIRQN